ncbi:unnamed protein product, partial [Brenthis ino]
MTFMMRKQPRYEEEQFHVLQEEQTSVEEELVRRDENSSAHSKKSKHAMKKKIRAAMVARWIKQLQEFQFEVEHCGSHDGLKPQQCRDSIRIYKTMRGKLQDGVLLVYHKWEITPENDSHLQLVVPKINLGTKR